MVLPRNALHLTTMKITILFLISLLAPLSGVGFDQAPAFQVRDLRGRSFDMQDHMHQRRILVLFDPPAGYLKEVEQSGAGFTDRDLVVLAVFGQASASKVPEASWIYAVNDAGGDLRSMFGVRGAAVRSVLVGKDTGIKERREGIIPLSKLFAKIDAMPMRRAEVKSRAAGY